MRARAIAIVTCAWAISCAFKPDLSRYPPCGAGDTCPDGYQCLSSEQICLPSCDDPPLCGQQLPDGGDAGDATDAGQLSVSPEALPPAIELQSYRVDFAVDGGASPYSFRTLVPLPQGLQLDDGGVLSGVPEDAGTYPVSVEVQDQSVPPLRVTADRSLSVRALLRLAGPVTLASAASGQAYTETLSATGGDGGYRFAVADGGTLPAGLVLAANGAITGSTSSSGTRSFDVEVTDGDGPPQRAVRRVSINVVTLPVTLQIATQSLPDGRLGNGYSYTLQRFAGTGASTWMLSAGTLPQDVGLDTSTGVISGVPSARGKSTFTIKLTDGLGANNSATFSIDVL
ncbi:MAG TPA: Ig domain-containing protein [Myxococcales bacterium]|nr:Ig domain-containing protein [Myxococcales bacterium]